MEDVIMDKLPTDRPLTAGDDELIERTLRLIRAYDAVRFLRDALSSTAARVTGYDWNADPDGVTKQQGDAFSLSDRVFADLNAAVDAIPEIDLPECQACDGTGKIEEAAKMEGANQHRSCVRACDECDGCGFAPDDEDAEPSRPAASDEGVGVEPDLVQWFQTYIDNYVEQTNGPDADALIACLDRVRDSYRREAALASPPVSERERELKGEVRRLQEALRKIGFGDGGISTLRGIAQRALIAQPAGEGK